MPWGLFRKKETAVGISAVGTFGKVPQMGDFVRAGGRLIPSFEAWLEAGMAWGEKKHREAWPGIFGAGGTYAFTFRPMSSEREGGVLLGLLKPSRDTVGRRFPLIVFGRFPEKQAAAGPQLLPLLTEPCVAAAESALADGDKVTSGADFQKHIGPMQSAVIASDGVEGAYDTWSHGTSLSVLWTTIYGDPHSPAPLLALKSIHEAVAPFSHQENATTPLGLRFPLGGGGAGVASFWIAVVRRVAHWRSTTPTCFWSLDDRSPSVLIQLGTTPSSSLAELWSADPDSQSICDLTTTPWREDRADLLRALPSDWASSFPRVSTVSDLLDLVAR